MGYFKYNDTELYSSEFNPMDYLEVPPTIIFEFGSYDGGDAIRYAEMFIDCIVYSFEPDPLLFAKLPKHNRVHFFNYAGSDFNGISNFYQAKDLKPVGSLYKATEYLKNMHKDFLEHEHNTIQVRVVTVESIMKELGIKHIDFIHHDTQGAGLALTKGFGSVRPTLVMGETNLSHLYIGADAPGECDLEMNRIGYTRVGGHDVEAVYKLNN